ncbi:hypothetical protein [Actinomadura sp. 9N215]|uniref:hypothetical protein n=1 Tax=Actinomadura sp. 9N215 TaxID=3375150 RepID=UPI0037B21F08
MQHNDQDRTPGGRALERRHLDELIAACEAENGPVDPAAVAAKLALFDGPLGGIVDAMSERTRKYSVTMPEDIAEEARVRSGDAGLSAYVTAAVARQLERDRLDEFDSGRRGRQRSGR